MNTRTIKKVAFWKPEGKISADTLMLYNFHGYNFNGEPSYVSYRIGKADEESENGLKSLFEGTIEIPDEVVQQWGEDDEPIFTYALTTLGLEEAI